MIFSGRTFGFATKICFATLSCISLLCAQSDTQISREFFGMHVNHWDEVGWPAIAFGSLRLWDTRTNWAQINVKPGVFDWQRLDHLLDEANKHHVKVLYTFGKTPRWASSRPNDRDHCGMGPGMCGPPKDLNADGSGTDQAWKDFVTAIVRHAGDRIQYWETWNEPYNQPQWKGTFAQMVRLEEDAAAIIKSHNPGAVLLTPPYGIKGGRAASWFRQYLQAGGAKHCDGISFHAYLKKPESIIDDLHAFRELLLEYGQGTKPLWDTEDSWGEMEDVDDPVGVIARLYVLQASEGITHVFWYAWGNMNLGTLINLAHEPLPAALAYEELQHWLDGVTFMRPCTGTDVWTCDLTNASSGRMRIVWSIDASVNYTVPAGYTMAISLDSRSVQVRGGQSLRISSRPTLLRSRD